MMYDFLNFKPIINEITKIYTRKKQNNFKYN